MGNIVNQFIAANKPKLENLQMQVDSISANISSLNEQAGTLQNAIDADKAIMLDCYNQLQNLANSFKKQYAVMYGTAYKPVTEEQLMAWFNGTSAFPFPNTQAPALIKKYREARTDAGAIQASLDQVQAQIAAQVQQLESTRNLLLAQIDAYNGGLLDAQKLEDQSAQMASQNTIGEAQATNVDIVKAQLDAATKQKEIEANAATSTKNVETTTKAGSGKTTVIVAAVAFVLIVGIIVVAVWKSNK